MEPAVLARPDAPLVSFVDPVTRRFVVGLVSERHPDHYRLYLDGLEERYRFHGVPQALDRPKAERRGSALFWLVYDGDRPVAGIRAHGPIDRSEDLDAHRELATSPTRFRFEDFAERAVGEGLVEIKGGWVGPDRREASAVADLLGRCFLHTQDVLAVRWVFCTCGEHAAGRWQAAGGREVSGLEPAAFPPDTDHRTTVLLWDRTERRTLPSALRDAVARDQRDWTVTP